jgi:hypothetical protein
LIAQKSSFQIRRQSTDNWFTFGIGRAGFHLNAKLSTEKQWVGVELTIVNDPEKSVFNSLYQQKTEIERECGERLEWRELPGRKASCVGIFKSQVDPSDPSQYDALHIWMLQQMDRFRVIFEQRIRLLNMPAGNLDDSRG